MCGLIGKRNSWVLCWTSTASWALSRKPWGSMVMIQKRSPLVPGMGRRIFIVKHVQCLLKKHRCTLQGKRVCQKAILKSYPSWEKGTPPHRQAAAAGILSNLSGERAITGDRTSKKQVEMLLLRTSVLYRGKRYFTQEIPVKVTQPRNRATKRLGLRRLQNVPPTPHFITKPTRLQSNNSGLHLKRRKKQTLLIEYIWNPRSQKRR